MDAAEPELIVTVELPVELMALLDGPKFVNVLLLKLISPVLLPI